MNRINLNISDKTITKLAGNELGVFLYKKQLKGQFPNIKDEKFNIVFPNNIDFIASSFIQGFFEEIVELIGIEGIENNFEITSETIPNLKETIIDNLI